MFIFSCKQEQYKKTANGLQYDIIVDSKKPKAQEGQVIKYHVYWRNSKDSLFLSTEAQNMPLVQPGGQTKIQW
jgi:hypothetical protein